VIEVDQVLESTVTVAASSRASGRLLYRLEAPSFYRATLTTSPR